MTAATPSATTAGSMTLSVTSAGRAAVLTSGTRRLLARMVGPLTGLAQQVGFVLPGPGDARLVISGGEMTGVHVLRGTEPPPPGAHHIGGSGLTFTEAMIKTLGETVERYAHMISQVAPPQEVRVRSADDMRSTGCRTLLPPGARWFTDEMLTRDGFPFRSLELATPTAWVRCRSLVDGGERWMLAQEAFPGYHGFPGEPHVTSGVSTGSAAHTTVAAALRNGLLELVQIDAAMGHWYGGGPAIRIGLGHRTEVVRRLIESRLPSGAAVPAMYLLPSPDLPGFAVACLVTSPSPPRVAVGLGCDLSLVEAIGKAYLEAAAVAQLAKVLLFRRLAEARTARGQAVYDLDENVAYYAGEAHEQVLARFAEAAEVPDGQLPQDGPPGAAEAARVLVEGFRRTGKELVLLDLTTTDVRSLGMVALRTWSPDVLTLSLPSAPPAAHPRFASYGSCTGREAPHPYP